MPHFHLPLPSSQAYLEGLVQGFFLEANELGEIALLIKPEPSVMDSILAGCPLELFLVNPNIEPRTIMLYVNDSPTRPYYLLHHHFGPEDPVAKGFDQVAIQLAHARTIKLALLNAAAVCVYAAHLSVETDTQDFNGWLFQVYNADDHRNPVKHSVLHNKPGRSTQGYSIFPQNRDHRDEPKMLIISVPPPDTSPDELSVGRQVFSYDMFTGDGKHGYHQESAVTNVLERFFKRGVDLFVSPKYSDGREFADYLIVNNNAVIVVESKYVISTKSTKRHQAITKAIGQLNRSEKEILENTIDLEDPVVTDILSQTTVVLKLCLLNSAILLLDENTRQLSKAFSKPELPIFIPVSGFFNLLAGLGLKNAPIVSDNLFFNLIRLYTSFLDSDDNICYYADFSIEGLSADELNAIGEKYRAERSVDD